MHRSLGFGSHMCGLFRFHFARARLTHITCKSIIQKVRHSFLWLLWFRWFPGLFHLSLAILFTFHSRYSFSIGVSLYLVLEVWFPFLQTSSWCSTLLWRSYVLRDSSTLFVVFFRFADSPRFARHYFSDLSWFLFLWVLRCFSSPGFSYWGFPLRIP